MRLKPDFSCGGGGIVNPEFIPASVRSELLRHLKRSQLTAGQKTSLLNCANVIGQMVNNKIEPGKLQRKQIETIEANAKRLLASLKLLGPPAMEALHASTDYLVFGSAPPIELKVEIKSVMKQSDDSLLSSAWDWIEALEKAAHYAAAQYRVDKQSKPDLMRARDYVAVLAERVCELTGAPPPKDRSSWFAHFCLSIGEHLGLPIGPRIVASGIKATAR